VRGSDADGQLGPDLTHFASRRTIGAGAVPNNRGHLGGWVVDAQSLKPGSLMPPVAVEAGSLTDLLTYLEGLE
ncbi:MAG: cytochrome c oxidase subunit II, partial [Egibacteraceae bacterium]